MFDAKLRQWVVPVLGAALCLFTLKEVNFSQMHPQAALAVFVMLGMVLCFLTYPVHPALKDNKLARASDWLLVVGTVITCGYIIVQVQPTFSRFWGLGLSLGDRAAIITETDFWIGVFGLILVLEATRRSIGWAVPLLSMVAILHAAFAPWLPDLLLPHAGHNIAHVVEMTYLQSLGVFGTAADVMFRYVFLFVVFGMFLEYTGATQYIIDFAKQIFGRVTGGPAMVAVVGSGFMGSLSGSAVANAMTTGSFTIPMMKNGGFKPHIAGGITAAAASGAALVPPVMGAGAYMMIEFIDPSPDFVDIIRAAALPAFLYYLSLVLIVYFYAKRVGSGAIAEEPNQQRTGIASYEGLVFFGALGLLIGLLIVGRSVFQSVSLALLLIVVLGFFHPRQRLTPTRTFEALVKAAKQGIALVTASACVGIIIAIVQGTGVTSDFNNIIANVVQNNLLLALMGVMVCSLVLGMGVPSVVCYILIVTLMAPILKGLLDPAFAELAAVEGMADQAKMQSQLVAHLFIFYFGMMSMVTPPVALAAYASASLAESNVMRTSVASFRFALVGFTLPYMFVYRPSLLLMAQGPEGLSILRVLDSLLWATLGIYALAAALAGFMFARLNALMRFLLAVAAAFLLSPELVVAGQDVGLLANILSTLLLLVVCAINFGQRSKPLEVAPAPTPVEEPAPAKS